jgi:hypothetical protein
MGSVQSGYKNSRSLQLSSVGVSPRRSEFREFAVESDKEEIRLCQEDFVCDLKTLTVMKYSDSGSV